MADFATPNMSFNRNVGQSVRPGVAYLQPLIPGISIPCLSRSGVKNSHIVLVCGNDAFHKHQHEENPMVRPNMQLHQRVRDHDVRACKPFER